MSFIKRIRFLLLYSFETKMQILENGHIAQNRSSLLHWPSINDWTFFLFKALLFAIDSL